MSRREPFEPPCGSRSSAHRRCGKTTHRGAAFLVVWGLFLPLGACSRYVDPRVPEPIRPFVDPEQGGKYELYRPRSYDRREAWPLVVVCHCSFPDSPNRQIRAWTELAESRGFLVAAPTLRSHRISRFTGADKRAALLRADRDHILATVRHIRAGHHISQDRIFIYGWGRGALAALYTGLSSPEIFRAVAVARPAFRESCLAEVARLIDPFQPIEVGYSTDDAVRGKQGDRCAEWLRSHGAYLHQNAPGLVRRTDCLRYVNFFENVIRKEPWAVIQTLARRDALPLEVRFKVRTSQPSRRYRWEFGDGGESSMADPIHRYAKAGLYRVTVTLVTPQGQPIRRTLELQVP